MAQGAIRYNRRNEEWEYSNDRTTFYPFVPRGHTHSSDDITNVDTGPRRNTLVKRGTLGEGSFSRIFVGGTAELSGSFLKFGDLSNVVDSRLEDIPALSITGNKSTCKLAVQDGGGRVQLMWNATESTGGRYLAGNEAAARFTINTDSTGSSFGFWSAPPASVNQNIGWERRLVIETDGHFSFGPQNDPILNITTDGDASFERGKVYAQAFETHSSRTLKTNIQSFTESALDILNTLTVYNYTYRDDISNTPRVGIIAEDVEDERIAGSGHDRLDVSSTIGMLIKAVQELTDRVAELEGMRS